MTVEDAKKCSFCGFTGVEVQAYRGRVFVVCLDCGCVGKLCDREHEAVDFWNRGVLNEGIGYE